MAVMAVSTALLSAGSAEATAAVSLEVSTLAAAAGAVGVVVSLAASGAPPLSLLQPVATNAVAAMTVQMRRFFFHGLGLLVH